CNQQNGNDEESFEHWNISVYRHESSRAWSRAPPRGAFSRVRGKPPRTPPTSTLPDGLSTHRSLAFANGFKRGLHFLRQVIRLVVCRKPFRLHIGFELRNGICDQRSRIPVLANEFCRLPVRQVDEVMNDQHLAIALRSSPDPDRCATDFFGDHRRNFTRDSFEDDGEDARPVEGHCVAHQSLDGSDGLALHAVSAHHVHRLRRESDVSHYGNFSVEQPVDQAHPLLSAFNFHRLGTTIFDKTRGIFHCSFLIQVIRGVGHVGNQQRAFDPAAHGTNVMQHLLHGDRQRVLIAQYHHCQRIADQNHVYARLVHQARSRVVVGGEAGDWLMLLLFRLYGNERDFGRVTAPWRGETHISSSAPPPQVDSACSCI